MATRVSEAIDGYIAHCTHRRQARNTVRSKSTALNHALDLWGNLQVTSLEPRHIDMYFSAHPEWAPKTANLYAQCLRSWFKWCRMNKILPRDEDPMMDWDDVPDDGRERFYVPGDRFGDLLDAAYHPLDRWVIALGMYTLMRGSEIRTLRVTALQGLDTDNPVLHIFRHKTRQADVMPVPGELQVEAQRWFRWLTSMNGIPQPDWYLVPQRNARLHEFVPEKGAYMFVKGMHPVDPTTPYRNNYLAVQRAVEALGLEGARRVGVHTLRASSARHLFEELRSMGYDGALRRVSSMLGHKNVVTTERYLGLDLERESRNKQFSGKLLFPSLAAGPATVIEFPSEVGS